jgi:hypothetical protein
LQNPKEWLEICLCSNSFSPVPQTSKTKEEKSKSPELLSAPSKAESISEDDIEEYDEFSSPLDTNTPRELENCFKNLSVHQSRALESPNDFLQCTPPSSPGSLESPSNWLSKQEEPSPITASPRLCSDNEDEVIQSPCNSPAILNWASLSE